MSRTVMYIFVNKGLGMSSGKMAAQSSHAAVEAYEISDKDLIKKWRLGKHYTKLIMEAENTERLLIIQKYIESRGFKTELVIDEGLTEIDPHTPTALGVEIVDKDDPNVDATFSSFKLYRDTIRVTLEIPR